MDSLDLLAGLSEGFEEAISNAQRKPVRTHHKAIEVVLKKYGITHEQYMDLWERQEGLCAGCEQPDPRCIDHSHETGEVRGLLCDACNTALGLLKDDTITLARLIAYLQKEI